MYGLDNRINIGAPERREEEIWKSGVNLMNEDDWHPLFMRTLGEKN